MTAKLAYAKVMGPVYGKAKSQKLHYTRDGKHTVCGLDCYKPSTQTQPWCEVCSRCSKIVKV